MDIANKDDIDRIVSEKLGISLEKVSISTKYLIKRLKELQDTSDVYEIYLSDGLGRMWANKRLLYQKLKISERSGSGDFEDIRNRYENLTKNTVDTKKKKDGLWISPRINSKFFKGKGTYKDLEKFQNNIFNEYKKHL